MNSYELLIENKGVVYSPVVLSEITLETERTGSCGMLKFDVLKDENIDFTEGNLVTFKFNGENVFYGYVFTKERNKNQIITVTAFDQMRYLKNKDSMAHYNKKASEVVKLIAEDFLLKCGDIEDTGYVIPEKIEDNKTLFDIIYNALDATYDNTGNLFVLYDDFGKLALKNVKSLKTDYLLDEETAGDFKYVSSINSDTYNKIKIIYEDRKKNRRVGIASDENTINDWGVLQYFRKTSEDMDVSVLAGKLLYNYNKKHRSLTVKNAIGDIRIRGGSLIFANLILGDINIGDWLLAENVKHIFGGEGHFMNLTVRGGAIV